MSGNWNGGGGLNTGQIKNLIRTSGRSEYLRKDQDDETTHTLTVGALKTKTFDGDGFLGHGARIDKDGNAVVKSIYAREFMSAPKFVFNEISVTNAEQWSTNAYGTILSVDKDKRLITLKLEENEYGSVSVGDICRGMYADIGNEYGSDSNAEGSADECGFTVHKGFFTTYFCVTEIVTNEKGKCVFRYKKRVPDGPDPCKFMDFAQYASFTDETRQSSMFMTSRGRSYHMILAGANDWVIRPQMRVGCYGCLDGITVLMKDGSEQELKGYGIYVQKNVYFGGAVIQLSNISDLEDLQKMAGSYDVQLSNYSYVITVDDLGNVIGGLYTTNDSGDRQYRLATTTYVRKGNDILTYESDDTLDEPTEGHYRLQAISEDCTVEVHNSTVYITAIRNIRDGVAGTDEEIDYDKMRRMNACRVTLVVELEGKTVKSIEFPIRIAHDQLPFMLCDLTNEHDSVSWNTKQGKYIGFPVETGISMLYHNDPYDIATVEVTNLPSGLKATVTDNGKRKNITFALDGTKDGDFLLQTQDINIHVTSTYAGAVYEYDKTFTLDKKSDAVIWDIIPSSDCIVAGKDGKLSSESLGVDIYGTSTDDKRFKVAFADITKYGLTLWYKKASDTSETQVTSDTSIPVAKGDMTVAFILKNANGGTEDKEDVPVVAWGEDGKGVEFIYKRTENGATLSPSDNPTPSDWETNADYQENTEYVSSLSALGWTDNPQGADSTHNIEYVCVRKSVNGVWGRFSDPAPFATFTTGVKSINTFYGVFAEGTSPSDGKGFTYDTIDKAVILGNAGKYVWSADFVTYSDGKTEWKDFVLVGKCDDIATVEEMYTVTASPSDVPTETSNWSRSLSGIMSQVTDGKALWSCDLVTYRNNSGTKHTNIQFVGSAGKNGNSIIVKGSLTSVGNLPTSGATTGDSYVINGLLYVYTGAEDSVGTDNDYDDVGDSYRGFTNVGKLQGDAGKNNYIHVAWCNTKDNSDGSFTKSNPDGKAYAFFGTKVDENASDESLTFSDYSWQCVKGESVTITGTEVNYQVSDSGTKHPDTWEENIVTATDEKPFLWTKTIVNFSGKTDPLVSYSVSYKGKDGKGVGIKSKSVKYAVTSDSTQPSDSDFSYDSLDAAGITVGKYVWCMTVITYDDASSTVVKSYSVTRIGADGKGVDRIESAYAVIDAGKSPDSNTVFGSDVDSLLSSSNSGKSIWSADRIFYVDGSAALGNYAFVGNVDDIAKTKPVYGYSANVSTEPSLWMYDGKEAASHATSSGYALWSGDEVYWKKEGKYEVINKQCIGAVGKQGDPGTNGSNGSDGDTTCDLFISSITQPDAPTVSSVSNYKNGNNLGGWSKTQPSLSADAGVPLTMENQSGNSHNWIRVGAGKFMSPSSQGNRETSIIKVSFYANTNISVTFNMFSSSEANYDYGYCSSLDSSNSGYENAYEKVSGESVSKDVTFSVSAGSHYVYFGYMKDGSGSKGDDRVTVSLVTSRIWKSSRVANGSSFLGSWSTPTIVASASLPGAPGEGGEKGSRGPMPRTYDSIKANTWYYSGADGEQEQSFVYSQGTGKWYECISTFYANSSVDPKDDSTHFTLANNFENVATKVLLAQRAKIDNLYVDDVNIVDDSNNVLAKMNKDGITCNTGTFNDVTVKGYLGGKDKGWKVTEDSLERTYPYGGNLDHANTPLPKINLDFEGKEFFRVGAGGSSYVEIRSDYVGGLSVLKQGGNDYPAFRVQAAQGNVEAIRSFGNVNLASRSGETTMINSLTLASSTTSASSVDMDSALNMSGYISGALSGYPAAMLFCSSSSSQYITLPSNPKAGTVVIIVQQGSGSLYFKSKRGIYTKGKYYNGTSSFPHSGAIGQFNVFAFDGLYWNAIFMDGQL